MKNLHKKIGALALAGIVLAGGVAASGVKSFAAEGKAVVREELIKSKGFEIKNEMQAFSGDASSKIVLQNYRNLGLNVLGMVFNLDRHGIRSSSRFSLEGLLDSSYDVFAVRSKGKVYIIGRSSI